MKHPLIFSFPAAIVWDDGTYETVTLDQRDVFAAAGAGWPPPSDVSDMTAAIGFYRAAAAAHIARRDNMAASVFESRAVEVMPAGDAAPVDPTTPVPPAP